MTSVNVLPSPSLALQLDRAAQQARQFARDRKAKAGAAIFAADRAIGLAEGLEDALLLFLRDADAGIGDGERDLRRRPPRVIASSTLPFSVNLNALDSRFLRTCSSRCGSVSMRRGTIRRDLDLEGQPLFLRDRLEHLLQIRC